MAKLTTTSGETIEVDLLNCTLIGNPENEEFMLQPNNCYVKMTYEQFSQLCHENNLTPTHSKIRKIWFERRLSDAKP